MGTPEGRRRLVHFSSEYRVAVRPELRRRPGGIACPTAIIWGGTTPTCAPRSPRNWPSASAHAELTMLDEAGHWVMDEHPAEVTTALQRLLARDPLSAARA
ncbi:pimeloyl-ACP methyl ester carboxylesterase [Streptomyces sp. V4I2]|nr:alpha/beta hydrolase [Streptomyces sp. V4I2]MDQ1046443.1 pimeloyl-ACP methyl ester carboxylesterase [Streptomyces sp. V4I2]